MTATLKHNVLSALMLVTRLYVGWAWLKAGWGKVNNPAYMVDGSGLLGFLKRAVAIPEAPAKPPISYDWYRSFLTGLIEGGHTVWFAKLVAIGELLVGLALILGFVSVFAASMGVLMNWAFLMAGTASTNGMLMALGFFIIMSGTAAGYYGLDFYVRPIYRKFMDEKVWKKRDVVGSRMTA